MGAGELWERWAAAARVRLSLQMPSTFIVTLALVIVALQTLLQPDPLLSPVLALISATTLPAVLLGQLLVLRALRRESEQLGGED